jgi:dipeptidyl aminopeptidase/acylaminoacyl peptidase
MIGGAARLPLRPPAFLILASLFFHGGIVLAKPPESSYQVPSPALTKAVQASERQSFILSPQRDQWVITRYKVLLELRDLAESELRLAGLRFNPKLRASNRDLYYNNFALQRLGQPERPIQGLPPQPRLRSPGWSPDGKWLAFAHGGPDGLELWLVDAAQATARRVAMPPLNAVSGSSFRWLRNSQGLVAAVVPPGLGVAPAAPSQPGGPVVQEHKGGKSPSRTFQDLLKNPHDADLFEHYMQSELWRVDLQGKASKVLSSRLVDGFAPSPDDRFLMVQELMRPFSYQVPLSRFATRTQIVDWTGKVVATPAELPLSETVSPDFDSVRPGKRFVSWRQDQPATVVWIEALDGGDAKAAAEERDAVWEQAIGGEPRRLFSAVGRIQQLFWGREDLAIIQEGWWKNRQRRVWRINPQQPSGKTQIFAYSSEDDYRNPGQPVVQQDAQGRQRLLFTPDGEQIYLIGAGASPEGERPFLDRLDLATLAKERLFHSTAPFYEYPLAVLDPAARRIMTQRETQTTPPNLVLREGDKAQELTHFQPAVPELTKVGKELIRYKRSDGVELTGTLYLPPGYKPGQDPPLPVLMWAYPSEFKNAKMAGQLRESPHRYIHPSWGGPIFFALRGYAVLDDPSFPIVGEGEAEPNDTYLTQLLASAQAAIDELVRRKVGDRDRMAIGGHSYGAFTTANLLAHSRLFRAGIARSGAFNRTLTPFGFQSEERTFWQARETYHAMSPFSYADQIKDPLLMIHGADDSNTGTFPLQSERLYAAIKGLGGNARLVMLPLEDHGYKAQESVLHTLWEMEQWLEQHVKNARPVGNNQ